MARSRIGDSVRSRGYEAAHATDALPLLRVQTLGAKVMAFGGHRLTPSAGMIFPLVLRLVHSVNHRVLRDTLLNELWPGQPSVRQRANLRQALYKLRALGLEARLEHADVLLDGAQIERTFCVERTVATFERDVVRGNEPFGLFLPGYAVESVELQDWLDSTRETVHGDIRKVLVAQLRARRERADWGGAEPLSKWLLQFDPFNEDATLALAECAMLAGSKVEAVAILDRYLAEMGPDAKDLRLPANLLRKRFTEPPKGKRPLLSPTDRHFFGREQEVAELTLAMRRARWHDGSAFLLHGPTGIGKSRITAELSKIAVIEGFTEIRIQCRENETTRRLRVLSHVLPEIFALPGGLGCSADSVAVLRKLFGAQLPEERGADTEDELRHSTEETISSAFDSEQFDGAVRNLRSTSIRHAVFDLISAVSDERPTLIVIEDAQWIDDDTYEILIDLVERAKEMRTLLVLSSPYPTLRRQLPRRFPASLRTMRIGPLDADATRQLTGAIGHDLAAPVPEAMSARFITAGEGNPLLLRELVLHWAETGDVGGMPSSLSAILQQRLEQLDKTALRCLQAITLLGRLASAERLKAVLQLPTNELISALEQLEQSACLIEAENGLILSHELVGRSAASRLSPLITSALRESIANVLSVDYARSNDPLLLDEIVSQLDQSGRRDLLEDFMTRHAEHIVGGGRPMTFLGVLAAFEENNPSRKISPTLRTLHARLQLEAGEYTRALQVQPGGLTLPNDPGSLNDSEIDVLLSLIDSAYRADPIVDRAQLLGFAAQVCRAGSIARPIRMRAAEIGLIIAANMGDREMAEKCFHALNLTPADLAIHESANRVMLLFHTIFGSLAEAKAIALTLLHRVNSSASSTGLHDDACKAGYAFRICGEARLARTALQRAYSVSEEISAPRLLEYPAWQLSQMAIDEGNEVELRKWTGVLQSTTHDTSDVASSYLTAFFCREAIYRGQQERALQLASQHLKALPRLPLLKASAYAIALELGANLLNGQWIPSEPLLEVAIDKFRKTAEFGTSDFIAMVVGKSLQRAGRTSEARALIENYMCELRREETPLAWELESFATALISG